MAMEGLVVFACAVVVAQPAVAGPGPERSSAVTNTLAVQTALQKGRYLLVQGDAKAAVQVLEAQLPRINGNREYLLLLRDAYRAYLKDLALANQPAQVKKYLERLSILDPEAANDPSLGGGAARPQPGAMSPKPGPAGPAKPAPVVRGKAEEDPFHLANQRKRPDGPAREEKKPSGPGNGDKGRAGGERSGAARRLVERAEEEFGRKRYASARLLYEGAHQADRAVIAEASQDHWAYCKLHYVVEQLNQAGAAPPCWADLEREVRVALTLAPKLDKYGQGLLQEIRERSRGAATAADGGDVQVRHFPRNAQGWASAETSHFRVFHNQPRELAERVARAAEQTRVAMTRKWFGKPGEEWNPRCDVYLHPDAKEYSRLTGQPASSPGHSRIETDSGRVVSRRIDLRCDAPGLLVSVLPHETTHVVLAGQFGKYQVPRWADEGMAVLTEPAERVDQHRKNLARCRQDGLLFDVRELLRLENYPEPRRVSAFYAQSVSLVDFLTRQRGAVAFSQFLRQALEEGYEPALRKHYNLRDLNELQASWARQAFAESTYAAGLIGRAR